MNLDDVNIITEEEKSKKAEKDYLEFLDDQVSNDCKSTSR